MAQKIKKGFFKILPWSLATLMVLTLALGIWQNLPIEKAAAAAPDGFTIQSYLDSDADGTVDMLAVLVNGGEALTTCTVDAAELSTDWTYVGNDIGGSIASASCDLGLATITFVITGANANVTGAASAPTLAYDNDDGDNSIANGSGNLGNVVAAAITDNAQPIILSGTYSDANSDGEVETVTFTITADTGVWCAAFVATTDFTVGTAGTVNLATNFADACASNGTSTVTITLGTVGAVNTTGGGTAPIVAYTQPGFGIIDGNVNELRTNAAVTLTDAAAPVILSGTYSDTNSDGEVETVTFTTTADTGITCTAFTGATDFTVGTAGTVTLADSVSDTCASNGTSTVTITLDTVGAVNTTGGATAPIVTYTQPGNGVEDGIGNDIPTKAGLTLTDAAAPIVVTQVYQDNDSDSAVDRITLTLSEDATTQTAVLGDFAYTANDITSSAIVGGTLSYPTASTVRIVLGTDGDANITGHSTAPTLAYTDGGATAIADAAGNQLATYGATNVTDGASPVIVNTYSVDSDSDGDVDAIDVQFSEAISDASVTAAEFEFDNDATNNGVGEEVASGGSSTVVFPSADSNANDEYYRLTATTGITGTELIYLHVTGTSLQDTAGNAISTGSALGTENDEADPVIMTTSPVSAATNVDMDTSSIVLTFSEAMTTASVEAATSISPLTGLGSAAWTVGDTVLTYASHDSFGSATAYTITVGGTAASAASGDGNLASGPVANPFAFTTVSVAGGNDIPPITAADVSSPNGGESWTGNSSQNITWLATGNGIDSIRLSYSTDGGSTYPNVIAEDEANDGSYTWTVSNISSRSVKVKVEALSSAGGVITSDISNANFSIIAVGVSFILASPTSVLADGSASTTITVTAMDDTGALMEGETVILTSSRDSSDSITPATATTDADGMATFTVSSDTVGMSTFTASVGGETISGTATVSFTDPDATEEEEEATEDPVALSVGDLIKSDLSSSVYYYGSDNKRHLFPNEKTYKTWYSTWDDITVVPAAQLQGISLGSNVTVRPGTVMLKIETDPKVYAVEPGGLLRWVPSEEVAQTLYGDNWNTQIADVSLIYWGDYTFGDDLTEDMHPTGTLVQYEGKISVYYIDGGLKRSFSTDTAFEANNLQTIYIRSIPTTLVYEDGENIAGAEDEIANAY